MGERRVDRIPVEGLSTQDNPFQSPFWAAVKQSIGWIPIAVSYTIDDSSNTLLILKRRLLPGLFLAYVPFGPQISDGDDGLEILAAISEELSATLCRDCIVIRYDVPWDSGVTRPVPDTTKRIRRTRYSIQPEGTVTLSLAGTLEEIYGQMRKRAKRNIEKTKDQVAVFEWGGNEREFDEWYDTYLSTSVRDGFSPRPKSYMRTILDLGGDMCRYGVESRLYIAKQAGQVSGGNIVLYTQEKALYLFGSSIRNERVVSPSYALQWYTVRAARDRGCLYYDLYGIAPEHEEHHHLYSLNLFKKGFGGTVSYRAGCFDYVCHHTSYVLYALAERIRMRRSRS